MNYALPAPCTLLAHNQSARTAYLMHPAEAERACVTVLQPDLQAQVTLTLPHDVARFSHYGTLTALHGLYGASILNGAEVLFTTTALGPHRFLGGRLRTPTGLPDMRGLDFTPTQLGTLAIGPHLGHPLAAATFRNATLGFFDGPAFSQWLGNAAAPPEACVRPQVLGEIYVHPHLRLVSVATPQGWVYSVDDARLWRFRDEGGWPLKLSDREVMIVAGTEVRARW